MARPYSMDLRNRVVAAVDVDGLSRHEAAARYGVAPSMAIRWMQSVRQTGSAAPGQMGGHKLRTLRGAHRDWLIERSRGRDFTLRGLVAELTERGLRVDYRSVWAFVHAEKLSFKKTSSPPSRTGPTLPGGGGSGKSLQPLVDPVRLVFLDETWTKTAMAALRG